MPNVDMSVTLAGVNLKNPVVVASGTFGFGREYNQFYDLGELGGISLPFTIRNFVACAL